MPEAPELTQAATEKFWLRDRSDSYRCSQASLNFKDHVRRRDALIMKKIR